MEEGSCGGSWCDSLSGISLSLSLSRSLIDSRVLLVVLLMTIPFVVLLWIVSLDSGL